MARRTRRASNSELPLPRNIERSRDLRKHHTDAESRLWNALRDRRLCGAKFRRQCAIGPFIADFACFASKLVIELDGGGHADPMITARDQNRSRWLEHHGWRVLRFWNTDVLFEFEAVLLRIRELL